MTLQLSSLIINASLHHFFSQLYFAAGHVPAACCPCRHGFTALTECQPLQSLLGPDKAPKTAVQGSLGKEENAKDGTGMYVRIPQGVR